MSKESHLGLRVAYDGKSFKGFQAQVHSQSVQQWIEKALSVFFRRRIQIQFSSRTDAGVHALDQIVVVPNGYSLFENLSGTDKNRFRHALNALLRGRAVIWKVMKLKPEFQLKKNIVWKEYHYQVLQGPHCDPLLSDRMWWIRSALDIPKIRQALKELQGTHDFSAFATKKKNDRKEINNVRNLYKADLSIKKHHYIDEIQVLSFHFRGNGFLYRMVRNIVGAMIDVGWSKKMNIREVLLSKKRPQDLVSAPSSGLVLVKSKISPGLVSKILSSFIFCLSIWQTALHAESSFKGSASLTVSQRFFADGKLGNVNGFSEWGALQVNATFGIYKFPYGIEPIVGVGYIKNSASLCRVDDNGNCILDAQGNPDISSVDHLEYSLYTLSYGARIKAWQPNFFFVIPYAQVQQTVVYGRVKKVMAPGVDQLKLNTGVDLGFEFGGGLLFSFMTDPKLRSELSMQMNLKDFCLMTSIHYLSGGFFRKGLGLLTSTGGWDFGLGLLLDW